MRTTLIIALTIPKRTSVSHTTTITIIRLMTPIIMENKIAITITITPISIIMTTTMTGSIIQNKV